MLSTVLLKMTTFLFIFFSIYAVSGTGDKGYYLIRYDGNSESRDFKVYWNVPTIQCQSKEISFDGLFEKYGIIQNAGDTHRGDKIAILYDPGNFPALIKNGSTGQIRYRNGGVPQEGSLIDHLRNFKTEVEKSIPDKNFDGLGIIDFESWRPIMRQNFGSLTPYKDVSFEIENQRHWWWSKPWIEAEAIRRFELAAREFMQETISVAKKMRPEAVWGYYGYPQCFNRPYNSRPRECAAAIPEENNKIPWLWAASSALFPSVYSSKGVKAERLEGFIRGRILESERVRGKGTPIIPYWWYQYRDGDGEYFEKEDLETSFNTFYHANVSGFIIWGSSKDVSTKAKCLNLRKYVTDVLGPTVAKYTRGTRRLIDVIDQSNRVGYKPETATESANQLFDPEYDWKPPENYTENIEYIVKVHANATARTTAEQKYYAVTNQTNDTTYSDAVSILENDTNATDLTTSIEAYTDSPTDIESSEDTSITNLSNNNSDEETSTHSIDNDTTSTVPSTLETSTNIINYNLVSTNIPKINLNDTSLTNFNATTNAPNLSSNINSTENYSLDSVSTIIFLSNDTSPMNESSTEVTASRPVVIHWNAIYKNLLTLADFVKGKIGAIDDSGGTGTTAAPELTDQVSVSKSAAPSAVAFNKYLLMLINLTIMVSLSGPITVMNSTLELFIMK